MKDKAKGVRQQVTDWEEKTAKETSDKQLLSKTYKELLKLKRTNQLKNGPKTLREISPMKTYRWQISM